MSGYEQCDAIVVGGSGYVAGELIRMLASHPRTRLIGLASRNPGDSTIADWFPHLTVSTVAAQVPTIALDTLPELIGSRAATDAPLVILTATPHGETASLVDRLLGVATEGEVRIVDLSADFRFADTARWEATYMAAHAAPARQAEFATGLPDLWPADRALPRHASQPGCFVTTVVAAVAPLIRHGLVEPHAFVSAVTGSSGSGRSGKPTTHHPARNNTLFAYKPMSHRHEAEMRDYLARELAGDGGTPVEVDFVPHSGPFVRGIHATIRLTLREPATKETQAQIRSAFAETYGEPADAFVTYQAKGLPALTDVVGTNACRVGSFARDRTLVVTSVLDNLIKGAAGGGIQWMNRLLGWPADLGLRTPGLGWY